MDQNDFNYEQAVAELEEIVNKLSSGNVALDDSLALYTRGMELSNMCNKKLTEVQKKISILNKDNGEEETFEDKADA